MTTTISKSNIRYPAQKGSLFYLGFFLCVGSFAPFINVYFSELGLSGQEIGWLATLSPLMTLFFSTPLSALADRKRWRVRISQLSMLGLATILVFLRYPDTFWGIAFLILIYSIMISPLMSIADSVIIRMADRYHLNYGSMRLWGSIGFASGAFIFGMVWQQIGFQYMFWISALLCLPVIWIIGQLEEGGAQVRRAQSSVIALLRDRGLIVLLIGSFLMGIAISLSLTFEGIYVRSLGGTNFLIGLMVAVSAYSELPTMFYGQRIARRLRGANTLILSFGLIMVTYLGYALLASTAILPFLAAFKGLGIGLFLCNIVGFVDERVPEEWASTAQSFRAVGMFGIAPLVAGPLGGWIYDAFSPGAVFGFGALLLFIGGVLLWFYNARGSLGM